MRTVLNDMWIFFFFGKFYTGKKLRVGLARDAYWLLKISASVKRARHVTLCATSKSTWAGQVKLLQTKLTSSNFKIFIRFLNWIFLIFFLNSRPARAKKPSPSLKQPYISILVPKIRRHWLYLYWQSHSVEIWLTGIWRKYYDDIYCKTHGL